MIATREVRGATIWFPVGTSVIVRKVGTAAYRPYAIKKRVDVPEDATYLDGNRKVRFWLGAWEVTADMACAERVVTKPCPRCSGRGEIAAFRHVQGGVCFKCGGTGDPSLKPVV